MSLRRGTSSGVSLVSEAGRRTAGFVVVFMVLHGINFTGLFHIDAEIVGKILEPYGALYGVLAAFITYVVWSQYYQTEVALYKEASSLGDVLNLVRYLKDQNSSGYIFERVKQYARNVMSLEWGERPDHGKGDTDLISISQTIYSVEITDKKDQIVFEKLVDLYDSISKARDERIGLGRTRMPQALWLLLTFSSFAFVTFFLMLPPSFVTYLTVAAVGFTTSLLMAIIYDLDRPFEGQWYLSKIPLEDVLRKFH